MVDQCVKRREAMVHDAERRTESVLSLNVGVRLFYQTKLRRELCVFWEAA